MTLPTVRSSATVAGNTNGSANTITRASGVLDTDYVILIPTAGAGTNPSAAPSGFSTIVADTVTQGGRVAAYGKVVGSDTTWSLTYPTAPTSGNNIRITVIYVIGSAAAGVVSSAVAPTVAATTLTVPSVTTTGPDRLVIFYAMNKASGSAFASTVSVSGATTAIAGSNFPASTFNPATAFATKDMPTAGATGTATFTWDLSTINQGGFAIALTPSQVALTLSGVLSPPSADVGVSRTLTLTAAGGNGNPITYGPVDWGDGTTTAAQSSNVFTKTPSTAGLGRTWSASASQSA